MSDESVPASKADVNRIHDRLDPIVKSLAVMETKFEVLKRPCAELEILGNKVASHLESHQERKQEKRVTWGLIRRAFISNGIRYLFIFIMALVCMAFGAMVQGKF